MCCKPTEPCGVFGGALPPIEETRMKTRPYDWYDTKNKEKLFSFQVKHEGRWMSVCDDNGPCFYKTEAERDAEMAKMIPNGDG